MLGVSQVMVAELIVVHITSSVYYISGIAFTLSSLPSNYNMYVGRTIGLLYSLC